MDQNVVGAVFFGVVAVVAVVVVVAVVTWSVTSLTTAGVVQLWL